MKPGRGGRHDLVSQVRAFLGQRAGPASSHMLAQRFLKVFTPTEELATRLLRPALEPAGLTYTPGMGWLPPSAADDVTLPRFVVVVFGGEGGADRVTPDYTLVEVRGEKVGTARSPETDSFLGATAVLMDLAAEGPRLREWLARSGFCTPESIVSLRGLLRGGPRLARGAGLDAICASLGVRWLETEDAAGRALAMAACIAAADSWLREQAEGAGSKTGEPKLPEGITARQLAALSPGPGIYRFYDAEGSLLYVGKAKNLRRRVSSYFRSGASLARRGAGPHHGARFLPRVHRLEVETAGSELEALLREARLIKRRKPSGNVQMEIHERGPSYGATRRFAILLPRPGGRGVTMVFVRDGRHAGHVTIGPRGGGLRQAGRMIGRVVCGAFPVRPFPALDRDSEILASWLARNGESVSRLDLDSFGKVTDAMRALRGAVKALLAEPGAAVFR